MKKLLTLFLTLGLACSCWSMEKDQHEQEDKAQSNIKSEKLESQETLAKLMYQYMIYFPYRIDNADTFELKEPKALWVNSNIKNPIYNYVFCGKSDLDEKIVEHVVRYYKETVHIPYMWCLIKSKESKILEAKLKEQELIQVSKFSGLTKELTELYFPKHKITRITNQEHIKDLGLILQSRSNKPETVKEFYSNFDVSKIEESDTVQGYLIYKGDIAVACGIMALEEKSPDIKDRTSYIDVIMTLKNIDPENIENHKGYGTSMLENLLNISIINGCQKAKVLVDFNHNWLIEKLTKLGFEQDAAVKFYAPVYQ